MRDLVTGDRSNCERLYGGDGGGAAVERCELHLECPAIRVDVHHRAYVTRLQALCWHGLCQDDSIVLSDHVEWLLLARIRGHEPRRVRVAVDDPNRPDGPSPAVLSVHWQPAVNNIFFAVHELLTAHDLSMSSDIPQGLHQALGILDGETERHEEFRLPAIVRVGFVEKIFDNLATIDDGKVSVAKLHASGIVARRLTRRRSGNCEL
jgi:hypothetical protein